MRARDNPFRVDRIHALRYRLPDGESWRRVLDRLDRLGRRAAVVGGHGNGKTTFLLELAPRLEACGARVAYERLRPGRRRGVVGALRRRAMDLPAGGALLVDGAGALPPRAWLRLARALPGSVALVTTQHEEGPLPTLLRCSTSPDLLADLVAELEGGRPDAEGPLRELWARHDGDLRRALRELYDRYG